jgi:hypothetical protein
MCSCIHSMGSHMFYKVGYNIKLSKIGYDNYCETCGIP